MKRLILAPDERAILEIVRLEAQRCGLAAVARRLSVGERVLAATLAGLGRPASALLVVRAARRVGLGVEPPEALSRVGGGFRA